MAYCMSVMTIKTRNAQDYALANEWCELFESTDKLDFYGEETDDKNFTIIYTDLNIDPGETKEVFKDFARYMLDNEVSDYVTMHVSVMFDNCGEEYQLLYILDDGEGTEQMAYYDAPDEDDDWIDEDDYDDKEWDDDFEDSEYEDEDDWYDHPRYGEPIVISLKEDD